MRLLEHDWELKKTGERETAEVGVGENGEGIVGVRGDPGGERARAGLVSWSLPTRVKPFNGLIRTQLIRRPKRADNLVSLGRFGSRCSKAQRWANMAQGLGETNMEPARGFFGRGRAGPEALNSLIA